MMRMRRVVFALVAAACAGGGGGVESGITPPRRMQTMRPDDRVLVPSMTIVTGVAVSDRYVFTATPNALGIFDRLQRQWLPPFTRADGWPNVNISVFMADPADMQSVWFAADNGVYHYRVGTDEVVRTLVPVRVTPDMLYIDGADPAAGVVVRMGANSSLRVSPNGFAQPINAELLKANAAAGKTRRVPGDTGKHIVPQTVPAVYARFHVLQDFQRVLTQDAELRSWPLLSAATAPTQSEVWFGSGGGGLFKIDPIFAKSEQVPFGLLGEGAGAVALAADGIWIGGLGFAGDARAGISFTDREFGQWRWIDGGSPSYFTGARVTAMSQYESTLWVATDRGVMCVDVHSGTVTRVWDASAQVPLSLVATHDGAWVGTNRTLTFVHDVETGARRSGVDAPVMESGAVHALVRRGDTLWIASDAGVLVLAPGEAAPRRLRAATADPRLHGQFTAIASSDSVIAAATASGDILYLSAATGDALPGGSVVSGAVVGRVNAMAMDAHSLWLAGTRGVLAVGRETHAQRSMPATGNFGGEAFGVALTKEYAWIATREGVLRLRRTDDGLVR